MFASFLDVEKGQNARHLCTKLMQHDATILMVNLLFLTVQ
jgi:hypothetical protein